MPREDRRERTRDEARARANEEARQRHQNTGSGGIPWLNLPEGIELLKPEEDRNLFSVVPWNTTREHSLEKPPVKPGNLWWRVRAKVHKRVGPNQSDVVCLKTWGKKCPICEERDDLFSNKKKEEAKTLNASNQNVFLIQTGKGELKAVVISDFAFMNQLKADTRVAENRGFSEVQSFYWPTDGYSMECWFSKKSFTVPDGKSGDFLNCTRVDFVQREDLSPGILKKADAAKLDSCLVQLSYKEVYNLFFGVDDDDVPLPAESESRRRTSEPEDAPPPRVPRREQPPKQKAGSEYDDMSADDMLDLIEKDGLDVGKSARELARMDEASLRELLIQAVPALPNNPLEAAAVEKGKGKKAESPAKAGSGPTCQHGYRYAVDTDEKPECKECEKWSDCSDAYDERKKSGK